MIRNIKALLAFGFVLACGGYEGDELFDEPGDAGSDLGQVEQGYSAPVTPSFQLGTQTASSKRRCNKTSSGQVCSVLDHKNPKICTMGSTASVPAQAFSSGDTTRVQNEVSGLDSLLSTWAFTQTTDVGFGCASGTTVVIFKGAVGSSGAGSNNINDYMQLTLSGSVGLTEGAGVVGSYVKHAGCNIKVDVTDINAKEPSDTTRRNRLFAHAVRKGLAGCLGAGGRTDGSAFTATRETISPSNDYGYSTGEICAINAYDSTNNGNFSLSANSCAND
jgi:hypothetical protein